MGGFEHIRIKGSLYNNHHARTAAHQKQAALEERADPCNTQALYKAPTAGQTFDATQPLTIQWDTTCTKDMPKIDIYLNGPAGRIHEFPAVDSTTGSFQAKLDPTWWGSSAQTSLSVAILADGRPAFMNDFATGPSFTVNYDQKAAAAAASASHKLAPGKTAAAVLLPILFVGALVGFAWFRMQRQKQQDKTLRYSTNVDKTMSRISGDWKSMTPSGAQEAVRASMYQQDGAARFSTFSFNNGGRPVSSVNATEGEYGQAGVGARGMMGAHHPNGSIGNFDYVNGYAHQPRQRSQSSNVMRPSFSQSRVSFADSVSNPPSYHLRASRVSFADGGAARQSRVSFADGARPSIDSRRSVYSTQTNPAERSSRAYHTSFNVTADAPPVPVRQTSTDDAAANMLLSPKQTQGAFALTTDDIASAAAAQKKMNEDDELGPALAMMRSNEASTELLFSAGSETPTIPSPAFSPAMGSGQSHTGVFAHQQQLSSSVTPISPLGPMPMLQATSPDTLSFSQAGAATAGGKFMSPDEMLRAYAEGKSKNQAPVGSNGMRQLYAPTSPASPGSPGTPGSATPMMRAEQPQASTNNSRSSWDDGVYGGM